MLPLRNPAVCKLINAFITPALSCLPVVGVHMQGFIRFLIWQHPYETNTKRAVYCLEMAITVYLLPKEAALEDSLCFL